MLSGPAPLDVERDAEAYFDQLAAPDGLSAFFGRPFVTVRELLSDDTGLCRGDLDQWSVNGMLSIDACELTPISAVFPMGFG